MQPAGGCSPGCPARGRLRTRPATKASVPRELILPEPKQQRSRGLSQSGDSIPPTTRSSSCPILRRVRMERESEQQSAPQGSIPRTSPQHQSPPLRTRPAEGRTGHRTPDPRAPGLANGKANPERRAPVEKPAAQLRANLEEQAYRCQREPRCHIW